LPRGQTRDASADDRDGFHFEILFCHGFSQMKHGLNAMNKFIELV
jgi:hypothetical protein